MTIIYQISSRLDNQIFKHHKFQLFLAWFLINNPGHLVKK